MAKRKRVPEPEEVPYAGRVLRWWPNVVRAEKEGRTHARTIAQDIYQELPLTRGEKAEERFKKLWHHYQLLDLPVDRALQRAVDETTHAILRQKVKNPREPEVDLTSPVGRRLLEFYTETIQMPLARAEARARSEIQHAYLKGRMAPQENPAEQEALQHEINLLAWRVQRIQEELANVQAQITQERLALGRVLPKTIGAYRRLQYEYGQRMGELAALRRRLLRMGMQNPSFYQVEKVDRDPPGTFTYRLRRVPGRRDLLLRFAIYKDRQGRQAAKLVSKLRRVGF